MAYTALEKMRRINEKRFGRDVGPMQPGLFDGAEDGFGDPVKVCVIDTM